MGTKKNNMFATMTIAKVTFQKVQIKWKAGYAWSLEK
jgi:hypothetical protein